MSLSVVSKNVLIPTPTFLILMLLCGRSCSRRRDRRPRLLAATKLQRKLGAKETSWHRKQR